MLLTSSHVSLRLHDLIATFESKVIRRSEIVILPGRENNSTKSREESHSNVPKLRANWMIKAFMQWFWRQLQRSSTQALTLPLSCAEPFWTKAQTIGGRWVSTPPITLKPKPPRGCLSSSTYLSWAITLLPALHAANTFLVTAARHSISSITRWGCLGEFRILPEDLRMFTIISRIGLIVTLLLMLGADHFSWRWGGWFEKKFPASACRKKKMHAAQM